MVVPLFLIELFEGEAVLCQDFLLLNMVMCCILHSC